jgi:hypothetical protein
MVKFLCRWCLPREETPVSIEITDVVGKLTYFSKRRVGDGERHSMYASVKSAYTLVVLA